jgi:hypothetical protein
MTTVTAQESNILSRECDKIKGSQRPWSKQIPGIGSEHQSALLQKGGQAHFAPKTPQNEPVPDGFGIGSKN